MKRGRLSAREKAEIDSLVESTHGVIVETVKALRSRMPSFWEIEDVSSRRDSPAYGACT